MRFLRVALPALLTTMVLFTSCTKDEAPDLNPPQANAGDPQVVLLPKDSVTLTGAGKSPNGSIKGYLWSLISGPNRPVIATEGAATTKVYHLVQGTYLFQFMVTDSVGLTGVDTVSIRVTKAPVDTLVLQPANNANEGYVFQLPNETGFVSNVGEFSANAWTVNGAFVAMRSYFKFDLSNIPAGANIISAKLSLYSNPDPDNGDLVNANSGPDNSLFIRRVTSSWQPTSLTWYNMPATEMAGQVSVPHTASSFLDLPDMDVTTMVSHMQTDGNFGFTLQLQNEQTYNCRIFCSSRFATAAKHPKLVIVYEAE